MIKVAVTKQNEHIIRLRVSGHAGSDVYGHDLVCAVVSGIAVGLCNAIYELSGIEDIVVDEGLVDINVKNPTDKTDLILNTGLYQLRTAEEVNKDFIEIKILEV